MPKIDPALLAKVDEYLENLRAVQTWMQSGYRHDTRPNLSEETLWQYVREIQRLKREFHAED